MKSLAANLSLAVALLVVLTLTLPAYAEATQIEGVTITPNDISQLLAALNTALKPNDSTIPIIISLKTAGEMPAYDPDWHYAGIQDQSSGVKAMIIWINSGLKDAALKNALTSSILLALADGGYGGKAFKQLYDIEEEKDAQLPTSAPDPFLNRRKLAAALMNLIQPG